MYKQTAYQEKVGNGPYSISAIGCFLTAFCNLAERLGQTVDPPTLNNFFTSHNVYLNDPGDGKGVKDDLGWNSITSFNPHIVVTDTGTGWPNTNNAIVKFYYRAKSGQMETHFCLVADHNAHTIIDSWDGVTKPTGEYGTPIGCATYSSPTPQPVVTVHNPVPVVNHPTTPPPSGPTSIFLPSAAGTWRVYAVGGPYTSAPVDHSIHKLVPGAFPPGLTYQVLDTLAPHIYKIQTQNYGVVAIYCGPDTIAQFPSGGHGEGEEQTANDNLIYTAFDKPMDLVTNKEATVYDTVTGAVVSTLAEGTAFNAIGKATVNDGQVYFVDNEDNKTGVKTVDLSPAGSTPPSTETGEDTGEKVPVKVGGWQDTYIGFLSPQRYVANATTPVHDIDEENSTVKSVDLASGTLVDVAGTFSRDGVKYYRTARSVTDGKWYGIPVSTLTKPADGDLDQLVDEIRKEGGFVVGEGNKIIKVTGLKRLFHKKEK